MYRGSCGLHRFVHKLHECLLILSSYQASNARAVSQHFTILLRYDDSSTECTSSSSVYLGSDAQAGYFPMRANNSSMFRFLSVHPATSDQLSTLSFLPRMNQSPKAELGWTMKHRLQTVSTEMSQGCIHCCESELSESHASSPLLESSSSRYCWLNMLLL